MKVRLITPDWLKPELRNELDDALRIINDNIWREASINYYMDKEIKEKAGKLVPKGMQKFINDSLTNRFNANGWEGDSGYFFKNETWIRITFRHQMSLGSDIISALKVCRKENFKLAVILAANRRTLELISPNDASALVSFEKLQKEIISLNGILDIPLIIGELEPLTSASKDIKRELSKSRPRKRTLT